MSCQAYIVILVASLAISLAFFVSWKPTMYTISYFAFFFSQITTFITCVYLRLSSGARFPFPDEHLKVLLVNLGMVAYACKLSTQSAEAGGSQV